ncbi:MAG: hypothetical protein QUS08_02545 [Methanothrix sp.]|nr:hypothetical protein [Methanothrix sp.]
MKRPIVSIFVLLLMAASSAGYEYHMPVNIHPTITPEVLMPGDEAILAIELENGAAAYGAGGESGAGSGLHSALLSTPINRTFLKGTGEIEVVSEDYHDLGMIGPDDRITIYYKIKAGKNVSSGTYLLDFGVVGGYDMVTINRDIPVKVDSAAVGMARAEAAGLSINLNIANPREDTVNAVTIIPSAEGLQFFPDEYYIGTMEPDEVFTIGFTVAQGDGLKDRQVPRNISFVAKFKNGDNWHLSQPYVTRYGPPRDEKRTGSLLAPLGAAALVLAAASAYIYRNRKAIGDRIRAHIR